MLSNPPRRRYPRIVAPADRYALATMAPEPAAVVEAFSQDLDPRRIWKALLRRRKLVALVFAGFVGAVFVFSILQPKQYSTQVKLIAGSSSNEATNAGTSLPVLNALLAANTSSSAETYAELIQQAPVALEVIQRLKLSTNVGVLLSHVSARPVTNTSILGVRVTWSDPETSANIANTIATVFVDRERQLVARQADTAIGFLQEQLPDAQRRMQSAQAALAAYQVRVGIADLPTQTQADINTLGALDAKENQAELDAKQAESQLAAIQGSLASTPSTIVGSQSTAVNPVVAQLQSQLAQLHGQLDAARQQYTDAHPTVIGLRAQITEAEAQLRAQPAQISGGSSSVPNPNYQQLSQQAATIASQVAGAKAQIAIVKAQRAKFHPKLDQLPDRARRITELQRESKAAEGVYQALQAKYQEAVISRTTALSDVTITQPAQANQYSVSPNVMLNLELAAIIGLGLALGAAFLAEFIDDRFRSEDDVKERFGLPVLASIPAIDADDWRANQWIKPLSVEAFYQLVASLRYASEQPAQTIAFVSPDQGDGKSTIAINTAISMGLMRARVLIVDADLRRPTIHQKLNLPNERGLADVLVGLARFPDVVKRTRHANVSVLTAGRPAPNPVGLLQGAAFDRVLKKAREKFDYIIIDGPALRSIVDGVIIAHKADGTVIVVSSQRSDARSVQGALDKLGTLGSPNLLGVVLNGVRPDATQPNDYYVGAGQSVSLPGTSSVG
jgi:capsular exopolysaccharide synthesis family protein